MMDCDLFRVVVDELVRGELGDADLKEFALDHARECPDCGIRLSESQEISAGLRALSAADATEQAPSRVEAALLGCLCEQRRVRRTRQREKWLAAAAAVIIAAGGGVWFHQYLLPVRHNPPVSVESTTPKIGKSAELRPPGPPRVSSRLNAVATKVAPSTQDSGFILLPYGQDAPSLGEAEIVRVAVTPAALASMGVPVPDPSADTYLKADLIVGEDGVPRAIRLGSDSAR
jgi:hypothetical protein